VLGGFISPNKGITYIASDYSHETLSEKDQTILAETYSLKFIRYAISYIKDAVEMAHYRSLMGTSASLIAKLERQPALDDALEITRFANELWLCRGDLGAELGLKSMAEQVTHFSRSVPLCPRPVLMAGQVLEHMTEHAIPTRSEVCFLYESLVRGYRGVVLSDETAIGSYPVAACQAAALFTKT
jgi:pyruvate kinase